MRKFLKVFSPLLLTLITAAIPARAQIVLSEIMFDPAGSEYYEEYIELYNTSATVWIDLWGYMVGDQDDLDSLTDAGESLLIPPEGYGLVLDPGYWGGSAVYDTLIPPGALLLSISGGNDFGLNGLSNYPGDTVILQNSLGQIIASVAYSTGNPEGHSEEKVRLESGDDPGNWANSLSYLGTPGFVNSVQPPQADLALTDLTVVPSPLPYQSPLTISARLQNLGLESIEGGTVVFARGLLQGIDPETLLGTVDFNPINPSDSADVFLYLDTLDAGSYSIIAWHSLIDNRSENDTLLIILPGGYPNNSIIINEIYPKTGGSGCEWIELFNHSGFPVDLYAFSLSDADTSDRTILTEVSLPVPADSFALLAQDSSIFSLPLPGGLAVCVLESGWPILNDDGDTPTLYDAAGAVQDRVPYTGWDILAGISLERISSVLPSDDPANWQPSSDPSGGTPGKVNSAGAVIPGVENTKSFSFDPDPFDPDRHGELTLNISPPAGVSSAAVLAFDLRGRRLKVIGDSITGSTTLTWDGRDAEGRRLSPGLYILRRLSRKL
jgi:hypothetical protein